MKCSRCQAENREGARFCRECAAAFGAVCSNCGTKLEGGSKFCDGCGAPLAAAPAAGPGLSHFASPESYTPKHLAERILTSKAALEGERKQVTVLFADLKGSMELLADRDPEQARKILDPVLEHMMDAVHRYEGTVNQVMGDGIMALFGAPVAHEDHAVRACYAALRMQESVKRYSEGVRRVEGVPIRIRVGLNSGEVVVRAIGSDLHMDYTAVGQTTHLAARMEQLADAGSTLLTAATVALAEGFVEVRSLGPTPVKGLAAPIEVFELTGASAARSRLQASASRGLTKFVGRSAELVQLQDALDLARGGAGQVVAMVGDAGVGKSRLLWEFTHSHRTEGCLVVEAASVSYGKATAYLPVIELLKSYFAIEPRDDGRKTREKLTGKLLSLDRALEASLPGFLSLLDVATGDEQWERLDPSQRRQRTFDGFKRLLLRESQVQPLIVVFEDLHWIDRDTEAILEGFVEGLPTARLLLLVNYRPEYRHGWGSKTYYRQLRIDPLAPASAGELLNGLLGSDAALDPLKRLLVGRTEGNPFFLEEIVRSLVETAALAGERGAYRLVRDVHAVTVPPTAQTVLAARMDRLGPEDKRRLQAAAVIGKDVPLRLLLALADESEDDLRAGVGRLQGAEFLYEARLFPEVEYTFKHALTHEVAYGSVLHDRRRAWHRRILEALHSGHADRLEDQAERLAHHALRAEVWDEAVKYLRLAGMRAVEQASRRHAIELFDQALGALPRLPTNEVSSKLNIDLLIRLRGALFSVGEMQRASQCLQNAETLALSIGDNVSLATIRAWLVHGYWTTAAYAAGLDIAERTPHQLDEVTNSGWSVTRSISLGQIHYSRGDYREAISVLEDIAQRTRSGELRHNKIERTAGLRSVAARCFLTMALAEQGSFARGDEIAAEAQGISEEARSPDTIIHALFGIGYSRGLRGDVRAAGAPLERALAIIEETGLSFYAPWAKSFLGSVYVIAGRASEAIDILAAGVRDAEVGHIGCVYARVLIGLAYAHSLAGELTNARAAGEKGLHEAVEAGERGHEAYARHLFGLILSQENNFEQSARSLGEALGLATELGMRPLVAHCHVGLANVSGRTGNRTESDQHFAVAAALYREMGMRYWLEKAEKKMKMFGRATT
jgi:class 3 adenylate cyclase/tetratricopeptide (TPR) repeat protein